MAAPRGLEVSSVVSPFQTAAAIGALAVPTESFETAEPQCPELGITRVEGISAILPVSSAEVPWLNADMEVSLRRIHFIGGTSLLYGSMVGGNHTLSRLAKMVCPIRSNQAQKALFTSLPQWLEGQSAPAIHRVDAKALTSGLYKVCRGVNDPARLFFLRTRHQEDRTPIILKAAVARHKDQAAVLGIVTALRRSGLGNMN